MAIKDVFRMPAKMNITGRSSSITNAFVNSIIPVIIPPESEIIECLDILGLDYKDLRCAYCGEKSTEWDHLRPIVSNKRPTGFISEIGNLVPSCNKCNESKGKKNWRDFLIQKSQKAENQNKRQEYELRIKRLEKYEEWGQVSKIEFEQLVDKEIWDQYWKMCENLHNEMKKCQYLADQISDIIKNKMT